MFPQVPDFRHAVPSSVVHPTMEGGAAPEASPAGWEQSGDWKHTHFIVIPLRDVKYYNREYLLMACGRFVSVTCDDAEAWQSPFSYIFRLTCNRATFEKISAEFKKIFRDFGGSGEITHYIATAPEPL